MGFECYWLAHDKGAYLQEQTQMLGISPTLVKTISSADTITDLQHDRRSSKTLPPDAIPEPSPQPSGTDPVRIVAPQERGMEVRERSS